MDTTGTEQIEVTVRFDTEGQMHPLKFVWRGTQIPVASTGRYWKDGTDTHILVMDHQAKVFELIFSMDKNRWYLKMPGQGGKNILTT